MLIQIILRRWNLTFLLCYHELFVSKRQHVKLHNILFKTSNNRWIDPLIRLKFNLVICIVYSDIKIQTLKTKLNKFEASWDLMNLPKSLNEVAMLQHNWDQNMTSYSLIKQRRTSRKQASLLASTTPYFSLLFWINSERQSTSNFQSISYKSSMDLEASIFL